MDWEFDNERPIYTQLVEQIERAVVCGRWAPGQKLPGVRELAAQAGVNPNTMQRALAALEQSGLLRTERTNGRFVTQNAESIAALRARLAAAGAAQYVQNTRALGCADGEITALVANALATENAQTTEKEETHE